MTYRIEIDRQVEKFLDKQSDKLVINFFKKVSLLAKDPYTPFLDTKKLKGIENTYRLRIGKWRFLYTINNTKILIYFFHADSRGDAYKR